MSTDRRCGLAVGLAGYALMAAAAEAAEHIVLESASAGYEPGQSLDSETVVMLSDGEFLVLATEDGVLLRIVGPFDGTPAGAAPAGPPSQSSVRRAIGQLLGAEPAEPGGLGGVRAGSDGGEPPDTRREPWLVHAERTGDQCVLRDRDIRLWRERHDDEARAEILDVQSRRSAELSWTRGEGSAAWPFDSLPVDAGIYLVRSDDDVRSVTIRLHTLPPALADGGLASVAWLASRGCSDQARLLLDRLPATDE